MKSEIVTREEQAPSELIALALEKGASLEQLEKLLQIKERYEANEAKKAYHQAMAAFKADPPKIKKDKKVGFSGSGGAKVGYSHASLGNVTESINTGLSKHGLSASWTTAQKGDEISVTTKITHKLGHSEETVLTAKADNSGAKNSIQAIGSTITYLERYGLLALTGLATFDQDNDGAGATITETVDDKEYAHLIELLEDKEITHPQFCTYYKIEKVGDLPKAKYAQAVKYIELKKKPGAK